MGSPDLVRLEGIRCRVRLGVPAAERRTRQTVLVDVTLETDVSGAAARDDFRLACDYQAVEAAVRRRAESRERRLLETLAEDAAAAALAAAPAARAVRVRAQKRPKVLKGVGAVVELRRERR